MNALISRAALGAILVFPLSLAVAQQSPAPLSGTAKPPTTDQHPDEPPCGPPPEAFKACEGKSAGNQAEFVSPRGDTVAGVCQDDGNGKIVLRPDHPPSGLFGGRRGPPPIAYQACVGKTAGNAVQITGPRGETIQGTCEMQAARLVFRPTHPPAPPEGGQGE